ncbi:MAG: ArnT family glycosyltransferase [Acidobacteriota bacterium]
MKGRVARGVQSWLPLQRVWMVPVGVLLFALLLRMVLVIHTGFDGLYGQDAFAYLDYAAAFKMALSQRLVPPPFFWPIGFPSQAVFFSFIWPLASAAQISNIVSGSLIAVLVALVTRELLHNQPDAMIPSLFAGLLAASAGQLLISSVVVMSDAAALFWATLSAFGMLRFHRTGSLAWLALAMFALGWAMITRWVFGLLIPVWGLALLVQWADQRGATREAVCHLDSRAFLRQLFVFLIAGVAFLLAISPQMALIADDANHGLVAHVGDLQTVGWNLTNFWHSDITNADGHFQYGSPVALYYALPLIHPDYVPVWFTPLILIGVWSLRRQRFSLVLFVGWVGVVWGLLAGTAWENWRFPLAFYSPLAVMMGTGLHSLFRIATISQSNIIRVWIAVCLLSALGWGLYDADRFIGHQLQDRAIVSWVRTQVSPDATVMSFGMTAILQHFTPFHVVEMAEESPSAVEQIARKEKHVMVLLDVQNVEAQWLGLAPQVNLQTLRDHFDMRIIGSRDNYTLFSVRAAP